MSRWISLLILIALAASLGNGQPSWAVESSATADDASPRFTYVDLYLDTKDAKLAAYQIEFAEQAGHVTVVGIEGGESPAFKNPPYYDPAALQQNRVILAAFSTDSDLPKGRFRVARIGLMIEGTPPRFDVKLVVVADRNGKAISNAAVSVLEGARP